ncbi:outer membrane receptor protein involved in Fe transport [Pedobacter cryoconitis]|uniref:Outer membrane receptor protein involved in Fe transport n=1 Tax=Pedobacter cryoconitis TaxID=188932 RepID=A0A7W9E1S0_9SPHI|nr:TonB-dependent receptor [Pedobacter cryoconitis]MBB5639396.1 outer membrane receptor protein involved in Fe transport [Pedobacter cryoconitis]MBB6274187.1 outer membrane receptor protein involved in Fe transport [Pedobacter cryoconitis]
MKRLLLLFAFLGLMQQVSAQFNLGGGAQKVTITGRISAVIIDSATKQPVDYATVSLIRVKDSKSVNGGVTDAKGKVSLQNVAPEQYKLLIGFMGYKSKTVLVKTSQEKPDANLGTIYLTGTESNLKEVAIVGKTPMIETKIDKLVYNAEQDVTTAGGNASDVMRKVPMVSVDIDGNPSLRGSSAVRVLINGKPSGTMSNSVADALKMIPAEEIKSVEVITSPSAKYDAEGAGGIINIITKKKTAQGINGNAALSVGTRQNNGNFSLNAKKGRLGISSNFGVQYAIPQDTRVVLENDVYSKQSSIFQDGFTRAKRYGYNGSVGLDYDINGYNSLSTNIKYNDFTNGSKGNSNVTSSIMDSILRTANYIRASDNNNSLNNIDWSADYRRTTKKEGEEFTVSGQASFGRNTALFNTRLINPDGSLLAPDVIGDNTGKNNEYTLQTDYVYPFSKTMTLETGVKGILRKIKSKYESSEQDFDYKQDVGAAYGVLSFKLAKTLDVKGGLRAEYTDISGVSGSSLNFNNNYFNLFPSAIISKTLKGNSTLKLSYNRRMQRPSLSYLNPFLNRNDPENQQQGNPNLSPEISDIVELGYSTFIKGSVINASVFYRTTQDVIESLFLPEQKLTTYFNVGKNKSYGANVFATYNPLPKWTLMGNFSLNTYDLRNSQTNQTTGVFVNYTVFARSAISFKGGWNTELFGVYNASRRTFQGTSGPMAFYGGAFKKDIMKKKATVGINVLNVFSRDLHIHNENKGDDFRQNMNIYYPLRSFGVNFSYKFGKVTFTGPKKKKGINNDDLKQDEGAGGLGGGAGGSPKQ